jgi:hypothetical protein
MSMNPIILQLFHPGGGEVGASHGCHNAVGGSLLRGPKEAVASEDPDRREASTCKGLASVRHHILPDIGGGDTARLSDQLGEEHGVVPGARPDLEDGHSIFQLEKLQHLCDERRRGGGGNRR